MKKLKSHKPYLEVRIKDFFSDLCHNPIDVILDFLGQIVLYIRTNIFFCLFVFVNLANAIMVRYFTIGKTATLLAFQPVLADLAVLIIIGALGYFMRYYIRIIYWYLITIVCTVICVINSVYYTFYESYVTVSLLSIAKYGEDVSDAIVDILRFEDFSYVILPICLLFIYINLAKRKYFIEKEHKNRSTKKAISTLIIGCVVGVSFIFTLNSTDLSRFSKQWNREYVVVKYGIYVYQLNDVVKSLEPKVIALFGYDKAYKRFNDYFALKSDTAEVNEYTNILKGKNIIVIHAESIQNFVVGLEMNGQLVAPNLTKLANEGLYFSNFYTQVSTGTSSDTEFTFNTGLLPTNVGVAFVSYADRDYISTPLLLKEQGYYNVSMHGNVADYWNRKTMHKTLGYDEVVGKSKFDIDEKIGLGLSDKSFFRQSVEKLTTIHEEHDKFYATLIMLTNHTPFYDEDCVEHTDSPLDITMKVTEEVDGQLVENTYPYMEGRKLGKYLKSVHYADEALGELMNELESAGLLENTAIVLYGDHDARLPKNDYKLFYNYDYKTDDILPSDDPNYVDFDSYQYELNKKTPFIIWTKEKEINGVSMNKEIKTIMGMYDVMPTLGNMLGFYNKYTLGHDMFSLKEDDNIVVLPTGNWITNKVYYDAQKAFVYPINNNQDGSLNNNSYPEDYVQKNTEYAENVLTVSNNIVVYNLLSKVNETDKDKIDESQIVEGAG